MWISREDYDKLESDSINLNRIKNKFGISENTALIDAIEKHESVEIKKTQDQRNHYKNLANQLLDTLQKRIESACNDPFFQTIRILLPDEVEGLRQQTIQQLQLDPNGLHSHCHRVALLILRLLYHKEEKTID